MGKKKTFWISLLIQLIVAGALVAAIYFSRVGGLNPAIYEHKRYVAVPDAWPMRCLSDALFIIGVMWMGVSGLMWIATTGFFDIFGYAFKSLLVLFSTLKKPGDLEHFADYKLAKEEKREGKGIPYAMLIVGAVCVLAAAAFSFVHSDMLEEYLGSDAHYQTRQEIVQGAEEAAAREAEAASDADENAGGSAGQEVITQDTDADNDTTGGDNNE